MAEEACSYLARNPIQLNFLRRLHIIAIEELGMLSSEMVSIIDLILRKVRENNCPFGNTLIIASGDPWQLQPISGRPVWLSPMMMLYFSIAIFKDYVRCAEDPELRQMLEILRKVEKTTADIESVIEIVKNRCRFVSDWDEVEDHYFKIMSKRSAVRSTTAAMIQRKKLELDRENVIRKDQGISLIESYTSKSLDEVETTPNSWAKGDSRAVRKLNQSVAEPSELFLYEGAILRLTYNNSSQQPSFSQGQLCIIKQIKFKSNNHDDIPEVLAKLYPPGVRHQDLTQGIPDSWSDLKLVPHYTMPVLIGYPAMKARRKQFPLANFGSGTIHKNIGETCQFVATKISVIDKDYSIWDPALFLTIVSRVKNLDNLLFVGTQEDTCAAITIVLDKKSAWSDIITSTLQSLNIIDRQHPTIINFRPIQPRLWHIPDAQMGFVYMIVSLSHPKISYVGTTGNITRRLQEHNKPDGGTIFTSYYSWARPWYPAVLVFGFPGLIGSENRDIREAFESMWTNRIQRERITNNRADSIRVRDLGREEFQNFNHNFKDLGICLTWLECAELTRISNMSPNLSASDE
jgi:hypothetical protein